MIFRLLIAALLSCGITALGHYYLFQRLVQPLALQNEANWRIGFVVLWCLTFLGFPLARVVPIMVRRAIEFFMFVWVGTAYQFLLLCFLTLPIAIFLNLFAISEAYLAISIVITGWLGVAFSLNQATKSETIVRKTIPIRDTLPDELEELKVVVLSDIHVAGLVGRRRMERLQAKVNSLAPDLVFVTGDLVDGSVAQLKNDVLPLRDIFAPLGVYYVTGNHEYYCNAPKWRDFCEKVLGWNVLSNRVMTIPYKKAWLNMIGIEDRSSLHLKGGKRLPDQRLENAVAALSPEARAAGLNILLAHQPKDVAQVKRFPWIDAQISGHTHGGQLWPLKLFVYADQKYNTGLYTLETGTQLYVNQGTGFWGPPMRLGTKCEISVLNFKRALAK